MHKESVWQERGSLSGASPDSSLLRTVVRDRRKGVWLTAFLAQRRERWRGSQWRPSTSRSGRRDPELLQWAQESSNSRNGAQIGISLMESAACAPSPRALRSLARSSLTTISINRFGTVFSMLLRAPSASCLFCFHIAFPLYRESVCVCFSWNLCGQHSCPLDLLPYSQRIHSWWASLDRYIPGTWNRISSMSIDFWNIVLSIFGRVYRHSRIDIAIQVSSKNVMSNVFDLDGRRWQESSSNRNINTLMSTCSDHPMDPVPVGGWSEVSTRCFGYQCMPAPRFLCTGFGRTHQPAAKTGLLRTYQVFRPLSPK